MKNSPQPEPEHDPKPEPEPQPKPDLSLSLTLNIAGGASSDIQRATQVAEQMVTTYGMSTKVRPGYCSEW